MIRESAFEATKLVTKIVNLADEKLSYSDNVFNIAYGVDKNFLFGAGVSITSILMHNKDIVLHFHVFTDFFDGEQKSLFSQLAKKYNTKITIYLLECEELKKLPTTPNWSYATYFRLILVDYLSSIIDKVLYLDADIVCKGNITSLTKINFNNNQIAAVVADSDRKKRNKSPDTHSLNENYFNAGLMLISTSQWFKSDVSNKAIELLSKKILPYLDQDALNLILIDKTIFIDSKWNTFCKIDYGLRKKIQKINDSVVFIHYIGVTKPWHEWATNYPSSKYFIDAKNASPWIGKPQVKANKSHLFKYKYKHTFYQKKYLTAILAYLNYLWRRIFV
ncbi:glycosyltransferase [Candidatus Arsenophonus triatominarum]|uniref:glycosyltransferase n=1 Tax=Candidatus Arsenophonus triatominarum TaxID=57911 RepID=UPI0007C54B5B|nr:glycosyltransferase [Candidatus Arsenophonus triatominarum]